MWHPMRGKLSIWTLGHRSAKSAETEGEESSTTESAKTIRARWSTMAWKLAVPFIGLILAIGTAIYIAVEHYRESQVEELVILSKIDKSGSNQWNIAGSVIGSEGPLSEATVWAIAVDKNGDSYGTDKGALHGGQYYLTLDLRTIEEREEAAAGILGPSIPLEWSKGIAITIYAIAPSIEPEGEPREGKARSLIGDDGPMRQITEAPFVTFALFAVLVVSFLFAIALVRQAGNSFEQKTCYVMIQGTSIALAFIALIGIGLGFKHVSGFTNSDKVLSLGYAHIFMGSYIDGKEKDWMFSLTFPKEALSAKDEIFSQTESDTGSQSGADDESGTDDQVESNVGVENALGSSREIDPGFGVPLWAMLLAVVGSVFFTLAIFVNGIQKPLDYKDKNDVCNRASILVKHQTYILFAPLGAIFVYQGLLEIDAASNNFGVAVAALAAGTTQNALLEVALKKVSAVINNKKQEN